MHTTVPTVMQQDSAPYYLLYGRHPLLPIDIEFGVFVLELSEAITYKYVQELKKRLENAFQKANAFCEKEALRSNKDLIEQPRVINYYLEILFWLKRKGFTSKHKIANKWETEPYEIASQRSDGVPVYTVFRNDRERTLHCNKLFLLGLWHDTGSILDDTGESENSGNPVEEQVDDFLIVDGEIDQPVYEGPQTRSHTNQLMKANVLMDQMFDVNSGEICDDITDIFEMPDELVESIKNLFLQFWYQQAFTVYMVCCDLAKARMHSINCWSRFLFNHFFSGEREISTYFFCSRTKPRT